MKFKGLTILLLIVLVIGLVGCTKTVDVADTSDTTPTKTTTPAASDTKTSAPAKDTSAATDTATKTDSSYSTTVPNASAKTPANVTLSGDGDVTTSIEKTNNAKSLSTDLTTNAKYFATATCAKVNGKNTISVKVTNSGTSEWTVYQKGAPKGKLRISNKGIADTTPGCDKKVIKAGESTVCSTIDIVVTKGNNRVSVQTPAGTEARIISCA